MYTGAKRVFEIRQKDEKFRSKIDPIFPLLEKIPTREIFADFCQLTPDEVAHGLVQRLHTQYWLVGSVDAPLVPSDGYSCTPSMPEVPHKQEEAKAEVAKLLANYAARRS